MGMDFFKYADSLDMVQTCEIYRVVRGLKKYAVTVYHDRSEDALDAAFFHICKNFNASEGDLQHYATKVVKTILRNKDRHEFYHEESLDFAIESESVRQQESFDPQDLFLQEKDSFMNIEECIRYLVPYFIRDFKFFNTKKSENRKLSYNGLFEKFSYKVIQIAIEYLNGRYGSVLSEMHRLSSSSRYRHFDGNRYLKSLDENIEYCGLLNSTVLYKQVGKLRCKRSFYCVDLGNMVNELISCYYKGTSLEACIEGSWVYLSLAGVFAYSLEELRGYLENEIVGALLAKNPRLRVVKYARGDRLLLSSSQDGECGLVLDFYGKSYRVHYDRVVSKRLSLSREG